MSHHCLGTDLGEEVFFNETILTCGLKFTSLWLKSDYQGRELTNLSSCYVEILLKKYCGSFFGALYLSEACMDLTDMETHNAAAGRL